MDLPTSAVEVSRSGLGGDGVLISVGLAFFDLSFESSNTDVGANVFGKQGHR